MSDIQTADIRSLTLAELKARIEELGEPGYRAKQIFSWLHRKNAVGWEEMSDLPAKLRERRFRSGRRLLSADRNRRSTERSRFSSNCSTAISSRVS